MTRDEWEHEYHLTPLGWVEGNFYVRGSLTREIPIPHNRIMTIVQENASESLYAELQTSWRHGWKSSEHTREQISDLLKEFGHRPPFLSAVSATQLSVPAWAEGSETAYLRKSKMRVTPSLAAR